jgi:hypothetical protein
MGAPVRDPSAVIAGLAPAIHPELETNTNPLSS